MFCEKLLNAGSILTVTGIVLHTAKILPVSSKQNQVGSPETVHTMPLNSEEITEPEWAGNRHIAKNTGILNKQAQPVLDFLYPELVVGS